MLSRAGCGESLEYGLKIAELHKVIAEKDKYISRLSEQAKAQIQVGNARLSSKRISSTIYVARAFYITGVPVI